MGFTTSSTYIQYQGSEERSEATSHSDTLPTSEYSGSLRSYIPSGTKFSKVVVYIRCGFSKDTANVKITIGGNQVASGTGTTTRTSITSGDVKNYFQSGTSNSGLANSEVKFTSSMNTGAKAYCYWCWYVQWYPIWNLTVNGGTGSGEYNMGSTATIEATVPIGYKFVRWSDGDINAKRTVTVSANATYTAEFEELPCVIYDSIFSFKRWANNNLKNGGNGISISNVTDTGFIGQALIDDAYTVECRPLIAVTKGKTYTFECDTSGGSFEFFIFNCNSSGSWADFNYGNTNKFDFTPSTDYISIRCDVVGTGTVVNFDNFRIYPADCPYMSNTVSASERIDYGTWSMPTPTREGYKFLGWFDINGKEYTSNSAFPVSNLVLYSQWKLSKIYIGTSQPKEIYAGTTLVKAIYVGTTKVYG